MKRRIIAMLMAIVMLVGNVPVQAFATEAPQETLACVTEGCTYGAGHTGECSTFLACGKNGCTYAANHEGNCSTHVVSEDPKAETAADAAVYVTVSDRGELGMAYEEVTVSDINGDGKLSVDEALYAAHTVYGKSYASENGAVTKLWDVETTNVSFFLNHAPLSTDVSVDTVSGGDYLVASVDQDAVNDYDKYSRFDVMEKSVSAGSEFTLTLTDDAGNALAGMEIGLSNGNGSTTMTGLTTDVNGAVTLTLDQVGMYCVTAKGTVVESSIDVNTMEITSIETPIVAPVCVVTVKGTAKQEQTAVYTQPVQRTSANASAAAVASEDPDAGVAAVAETQLTVSGSTIDIEDKDLSAYVITTLTINGATVTSAIQNDTTINVVLAEGTDPAASLSVGFAGTPKGGYLVTKNNTGTLSDGTGTITVTVAAMAAGQPRGQATYTINFTVPMGTAYTVTPPTGEGFIFTGKDSVYEGKDYNFSIYVNEGYNSSNMVVKVNGDPITGTDGSYTVSAVSQNLEITVEGIVAKERCTVTLTEGDGYTISSDDIPYKGEDYTFSVAVDAVNYKADTLKVLLDGEPMIGENGVYTIPALAADHEVTVTVDKKAEYTVNWNELAGVTITGEKTVLETDPYTFTVQVDNAYDASGMKILVNDQKVTLQEDGSYTIDSVDGDIAITVEGVEAKVIYTVSLTEGENYTISGQDTSYAGEAYTFTITVDDAIYFADQIVVKVNDTKVELKEDGTYTFEALDGDKTVTVENVVERKLFHITKPEVDGVTFTGADSVREGKPYAFSIAVANTHLSTDMVVKVNGAEVSLENGSHTIEAAAEDMEITVEGVRPKEEYTVTKNAPEGVTIGGAETVLETDPYSFTVTVAEGYDDSNLAVAVVVGEEPVDVSNGYSIASVTGNVTITVTGVEKKQLCNITLPTGKGYTVTGAPTAYAGDSYTFTVSVAAGYVSSNMVVTANGDIVPGNNGSYTITVEGDTEIAVTGVEREPLPEKELTVTDNVIDITDKTVYSRSSFYAKAIDITVSGATVKKAYEDNTTIYILLPSNTADDAQISVTFGTAVNRCSMSGTTGSLTLAEGDGVLPMTLKGQYGSFSSLSGTATYNLIFIREAAATEVPVRIQETDSAEMYRGKSITFDLDPWFTGEESYYLVESTGNTPVERYYTFNPDTGGTYTLLFGAANAVGECPEHVTVTVNVKDVESGVYILHTSGNGSMDSVQFQDAGGNPIEGLAASYDAATRTINVLLPKNYDVSGTVKAVFTMMQNASGYPFLSTVTETTGNRPYNSRFTEKAITLTGGAAQFTFYYYNTSTSATNYGGQTKFTISLKMKNDLPVLAEGVSATAEATITAGKNYTLDLSPLFTDVDGDALTYWVSVNGADAVEAADAYSYTTDTAGTYTLVFTANDGKGTSTATYTVTLTVENADTTYAMTANLPEGLNPKFYVCSGYGEDGLDQLGAEVETVAGEAANGTVAYTLNYPTNASAISVRAEEWGGMSFAAEENAAVTLRQVQMNVVDYDNKAAESTNTVSYDGHTAASGTNGWLLVTGQEYTYTAAPKDTATLETASTTEKLEAGEGIHQQQLMLGIKNPITITVTTGATAQLYNYDTNKYYYATEFEPKIIADNGDGTTTYSFVGSGSCLIYRVSMEGKVTKAGYFGWNQRSVKAVYDADDVASSYRLDDYSDTNSANSGMTEDSVVLNVNGQNHLSMNVGDSRTLKAYRIWEIIKISYQNYIITPDFTFNILSGSDVISLEEKDSPSVGDGDWMTLTALKEGTAVIEVTYGAMEIAGGSYDGIYGASDPARTGLVVVQVGGNDASVNFGIDSFASRGKSYSDHIAYNSSAKRAWDAEFDTLYFTGSSGLLKLSPTAASAIKEVAVSHDKGGSWTQLTAQEGVYTAPIVSGNNILRITTEAGVAYQVVRGDRITVQISDVGDSSDGDGKIEPGETARITLKGLHMPIPKMAGNYNPGFGGNSDGYSSVHLNYTANGQAVHGPGTQYTFINDANYLDIAIPTDIQTDKLTLTDGYIGVGVLGLTQFDVGGDSHRNIPDGGCGTRESKTTFHTRSILPEITVSLEGVKVPVSVTGVSLDKTELTLNVNDTETLTAAVTPENAVNKNVTWSSSNSAVATAVGGVVNAVGTGTAIITVTTEDGAFADTCEVTVKQPVESVKVTPESSEVEAGKTVQLTAQVEPENATDKTVTWTSSDKTVATVDETGVVTGVKTGTATITATAGEVSATSTVQVTEAEKSVTVAFTAQANGEFLAPPQLEMTVSANTAESYGYNDQTNQTTQVSAMDVLVAAHVAKFGESFTLDTSRNYLVVEGNFITAMFGSNNGGNVCMLVNGIQPGTAEYRLGVEQAVIADGDLVEFFIYQNAKYTDKYVWLELPDGTNLDGQTVYGGKSTTVIVKGRSPYSYGYEGDAGNTVISGAAIYMVDIQTGTLTSLDVTTGADGSASIKVPSSYVGETVYLAAKGTEMAMTLAKVKIERAPISTACNLDSLEIAVGGNTIADAAVKQLTPTFTGARTEYTTAILDYESDKNNRFVWVKVSAPEGTTVTAKCANSDIATLVSGEWVVLQEKGGYFWAPTYSGPLQTGAYNEVQITVSKEGEDDKVYIVTIPMQPDIANRSLKWKTDLDDAVYITKNTQDASLTVEAQYQNRPLENENVVTYQWYSNTAASTEGSIAIEGATEAVYQPDVTGLGTSYYYAVASCKDLESITSNIIAVTVTDEAAPTSVRIVCDHPYTVPNDWIKALGGVDYIAKAGDTLQLKAVDANGKETPVVWLNTSLNGGTLDRETGIYTISNTTYSYVQVASLYDTTIKSEEKAIVVKDYSINQYNKTPSVTLSSDGQSFPYISTQGGIDSHTLWKYTLSADNIAQLDTDLEKKPPYLKFIAMRPGTIQATLDLDLNGDGVADGNGHTDTATMSINGIAVEDAEGQLTKTYLEISTAEPNPTAQLTAISSTEDPVFTWSSNDETVATVDEKGVVTAQSVGSTIISVTDGTYTGGIKLVVTSADTPYFEQIDFVTTNAWGIGLSNTVWKTASFKPTILEYTGLSMTKAAASTLTLNAATLYNTEKYTAVATYTDANGEEQNVPIASGAATELVNIPFETNIITITIAQKDNGENKTEYTFQVTRPRDTVKTIANNGIVFIPDGRESWADKYNGKTEGIMYVANEDGSFAQYQGVSSSRLYYRTYAMNALNAFSLTLKGSSAYTHIRFSTDDGVTWTYLGQTGASGLSTGKITIPQPEGSEHSVVKVMVQILDDKTYTENVAAEKDGFADSTPSTYSLWVEQIPELSADCDILTATTDDGDWYPSFDKSRTSYRIVVAPDAQAPTLTFTVSEGAKVTQAGEALTPDENGVYSVEVAFGYANYVVSSSDGSTEKTYSFGYSNRASEAVPDKVTDYLLINGQYINGGGGAYGINPQQTLTGNGLLSLGNFGGYVTFYYENGLTDSANHPYGVDFYINGNAFKDTSTGSGLGSMEPGQVWVSENGTEWYALAGSEHYEDGTLWDYAVTYSKTETGGTAWKDNQGNTHLTTHGRSFAWPSANIYTMNDLPTRDSFTLSGILIPCVDGTITGKDVFDSYSNGARFGYVDTFINGTANPYLDNREYTNESTGFDLAWAVDGAGNPVDVSGKSFHYVKVVTASNIMAGAANEKSTEVGDVVRATAASQPVGVTDAPSGITFTSGEETYTIKLADNQQIYEVSLPDMSEITLLVNGTAKDDNIYINNQRVTDGTASAAFDIPADSHKLIRIIVQNGEKEPVIYLLKVTNQQNVAVTGITVTPESVELEAGKTAKLTAQVEPENATDKTVTWTSSDETVATVENGVVTGVKAGTATITATAGEKTAACTVTVTEAQQEPATSGIDIVTNDELNGNYDVRASNIHIGAADSVISNTVSEDGKATVLITEDAAELEITLSLFAKSKLIIKKGYVALNGGTPTIAENIDETAFTSTWTTTIPTEWDANNEMTVSFEVGMYMSNKFKDSKIYTLTLKKVGDTTGNTAPSIAETAPTTGTANQYSWYELDLGTVFEDTETEDSKLIYQVNTDGEWKNANQSYSYLPKTSGTKELKFKAKDAVGAESPEHTITLEIGEYQAPEHGLLIGNVTDNGVLKSLTIQNAEGTVLPVEFEVDEQAITVYLPGDQVSGNDTVKAVFDLEQVNGLPFLSRYYQASSAKYDRLNVFETQLNSYSGSVTAYYWTEEPGTAENRNGYTITYRKLVGENQAPALADGVEATVTDSIAQYQTWSVDLSKIFTEPDEEAMTYTVSVNNGAAKDTDASYSYECSESGTVNFVFKAAEPSGLTATYKVTLTVTPVPRTVVSTELTNEIANGVFCKGIQVTGYTLNSRVTHYAADQHKITFLLQSAEDDASVELEFLSDFKDYEIYYFASETGKPTLESSERVTGPYTVTLENGEKTLYLATTNAAKEQRIDYQLIFRNWNNEPVPVNDTYSDTCTVQAPYEFDLSDKFSDQDDDPLNYAVTVDGGDNWGIDAQWEYTAGTTGEHTLVFTAFDGFVISDPYTVTLNAEISEDVYTVDVKLPETVTPAFYITDSMNGETGDVLGDPIGSIVGETTDGWITHQVLIPDNISRISIRGTTTENEETVNWGGMSILTKDAEGNPITDTVVLRQVKGVIDSQFNGAAPASADAKFVIQTQNGEYPVSGSAYEEDGYLTYRYLLVAQDGYTYSTVATGSLAEKYGTKVSESTYSLTTDEVDPAILKLFIDLKNGMYVTVPQGSVIHTGKMSNYFKYYFFDEYYRMDENQDGTVTYIFEVPAKANPDGTLGGEEFIRVQHPRGVTYWTYDDKVLTAGGELTLTDEDLFIGSSSYNSKTVIHGLSEIPTDVADIYLSVNKQMYLDLDAGESYKLNVFRNWQAVEGLNNAKTALPDVHYAVISPTGGASDVVTITTDEFNSSVATVTANKAGTAIVLVTYDAMYSTQVCSDAMGYSGKAAKLSAIWPENTGVFVVSVGADGSSIVTNIDVDAEHDPIYYVGNAGAELSFTPDDGCTVSVARAIVGTNSLTYGGFSTNGVTVDSETGEVTVTGLKQGRHIIRVEKDGVATYQVVTTKQTSYTISDAQGNVITDKTPVLPGTELTIQFDDLYNPVNKLAGVYNSNCALYYTGEDGTVFEGSNGGTVFGFYVFAADHNLHKITVTVPTDWNADTYRLEGSFKIGGFGGGGGGHRGILLYETGRNVNNEAEGASGNPGVLPTITIPVTAKIPAEEITLNSEKLELQVGETANLVAEIKPADSTEEITWKSSNPDVATVDDGTVTAIGEGTATITVSAGAVSDTCTVTVEPKEIPDDKVEVYFSVSHDAEFLKTESGKVMALQKLAVPYFDLALYDLGDLNLPESHADYGKPTMFHLYIYATEVFQYDVPAEEAGKGYLKDYIGSDMFAISGTPGSICLDKFWGYDMNLNYYHNYIYPADESGYGITADRVALKNGDIVTIGHFTSWSFFGDSSSIFNYIAAGNDTVVTSALQSDALSLQVYRAGPNLGTGGSNTPRAAELDIYYVKAEDLTSGDVTTWTKLGTTDATGKLTVDLSKLSIGQYILAVAGQKGEKYPNDIVSTPGGIVLNVNEDPQVQKVIGMIDSIGEVTVEDESAIAEACKAYDALTETQKKLVTNYEELTAAEKKLDELNKAAADAVIQKIAAIGPINEVTLDSEGAITAADDAFNALTETQQLLVTNRKDLADAKQKLADLKSDKEDRDAVEAVKKLIDAIDKEDSNYQQQIQEALDAFNGLNEHRKILLGEDYAEKVTDAQNALTVMQKIDAIGDVALDEETEKAIEDARKAYDALKDEQKDLVNNYDDLNNAEAKLKDLKDEAEAQKVIDLIKDIGENVTLDDEKAIEDAKKAYDDLTDEQKKLVDNHEDLISADAKLNVLKDKEEAKKVNDLIEKIGDDVTLDDEETIQEALEAYEDLTDAQKKYVNYDELKDAQEELWRLKLSNAEISEIYTTTRDYLAGLDAPGVGSIGGEWRVIGLKRSGEDVAEAYYDAVVAYVQKNIQNGRLHTDKSSDNSRIILALTAIGKDVTNVGGHNLLSGLNEMSYISNQGINGVIWALIAFDSHNYPTPAGITREELVNAILAAQLSDGGWALAGETADPDMTGMALQALAPYYGSNEQVKAAVDEALDTLSRTQNSDGTFSGSEGTTCESLAQVITALTALGIDPETDARFVKNNVSALKALAAFYVNGGGFKHGLSTDRNMMATEQGFYALVSYYRYRQGQTALYDMSDVILDKDAAVGVVALINAIGTVDLSKEDEVGAARTAYDALTNAQKELVTNYKTLTDAETKLAQLMGTPEDREKANAVKALIDAIGTVNLSKEDAIEAARNAYNRLTTVQKALVDNYATLTAAEARLATLQKAAADEAAAQRVENLISAIGSNINAASESKIQTAENAYKSLTADQKALVSNYQMLLNARAALDLLKSTVSVTFELKGCYKHGTGETVVHTLAGGNLQTWIAAKTYKVKPGATVKDLFEQALTAARLTWKNPTGNYVESITRNGVTIGEFTNGSKSGWMYTLNGKHPGLGVNQQTLVNGDKVVFHYTDDYTKEEGNPSGSTTGTTTGTTSGTVSGSTNYITTTTTTVNTETAESVDRLIEDIGEEITLESEAKILAARAAYDKLTEAQKKLVEKYDLLVAAEAKLAELKGVSGESENAYIVTGDYLQALGTPGVGTIGGEWMVIGLARSGRPVPSGYYDHVLNYVRENINDAEQLHSAKSSDNSRLILALTAIGKDVTNVDGHDLLKGLNDMDYIQKQGINGPIWALLAFDSGNYPVPEGNVSREALIDVILEAQLSDGGWALSGERSDPDMTGMAIQALAPYMESNMDVKKAVEEAIWTLSELQNDNGSYTSVDGPNSESIAQVIVALAALGIDADTDARFVKNGISALDALLTYYIPGGGFRHILDGNLDGMSTEQAFYALVAYERMKQNQNFLYDMTDVVDAGGDVIVEETTEPTETPTEPAVEEEEDNGNNVVIWTGVMSICAAAIAVLLLNRKKLFGKF